MQITPVQIFKYQTIIELAAHADSAPVIEAEQGIVTGNVILTPIQRKIEAEPCCGEGRRVTGR